jgi:hypothetical protein
MLGGLEQARAARTRFPPRVSVERWHRRVWPDAREREQPLGHLLVAQLGIEQLLEVELAARDLRRGFPVIIRFSTASVRFRDYGYG